MHDFNAIIKMDTIFMNPENSETSEPYVLILKFTDKLNLSKGEKNIALSNTSVTINITINSKDQL